MARTTAGWSEPGAYRAGATISLIPFLPGAWAILINKTEWEGLPADIRGQMQGAMSELEKDAYSQYNTFVQAALDNMKKNGIAPWSAPQAERAKLDAPLYAKPAIDSWVARAKEVGFDGTAYLAKVRAALGKPPL
jgi:TRAP-type C4-dicarboxylate transport system substrate-binding protein